MTEDTGYRGRLSDLEVGLIIQQMRRQQAGAPQADGGFVVPPAIASSIKKRKRWSWFYLPISWVRWLLERVA